MKKFTLAALALTASFGSAHASIIDYGSYFTDTDSGLDWLQVTESAGRSYTDVSAQFVAGGDFEGWRYATRSQLEGMITSNFEGNRPFFETLSGHGRYPNFGYTQRAFSQSYRVTIETGERQLSSSQIQEYGLIESYQNNEFGYTYNGRVDVLYDSLLDQYLPDSGKLSDIYALAEFPNDNVFIDTPDPDPTYFRGTTGLIIDDLAPTLAMTTAFFAITTSEGFCVDCRLYFSGNGSTNSKYGGLGTGSFLVRGDFVSAVPVPAAVFMFAPALLGFMGLRRKAKNSVA